MATISSPVLIASPSDVDHEDKIKSMKFKLRVKPYCWTLPKIIKFSCLKQAVSTVNLYCQTCTNQELVDLTKKTSYLRVMSFQDEPNFLERSYPYVYVYQRPIQECIPEHKQILDKCPKDCVPGEINMQSRGYFVWIKMNAVEQRKIGSSDITLVDVKEDEEESNEDTTKFSPYIHTKYYYKKMYLGGEGSPLSSTLAEGYFSLIKGDPNELAEKHLDSLVNKIFQFNPEFEGMVPNVNFQLVEIDLMVVISID